MVPAPLNFPLGTHPTKTVGGDIFCLKKKIFDERSNQIDDIEKAKDDIKWYHQSFQWPSNSSWCVFMIAMVIAVCLFLGKSNLLNTIWHVCKFTPLILIDNPFLVFDRFGKEIEGIVSSLLAALVSVVAPIRDSWVNTR